MKTYSMSMLRAATVLSIMTLALSACKKSGTHTVPTTAEGRIEAFAQVLPASSPGAFYVGDFAKMQTSLDAANKSMGSLVPDFKASQEELKKTLGFDIQDPESWKTVGIAPHGGLGLGVANFRLVLTTYVNDQAKFNAYMADKVAKGLELGSAKVKTEQVDGKTIHILGEDTMKQIAWLHHGKMVLVASPPFEKEYEAKAGSIKDALVALTKTNAATSSAASEQFKDFKSKFTSYDFAGFINFKKLLEIDEFKKQLDKEFQDPEEKKAAAWLQKTTNYVAVGVGLEQNVSKTTIFVGINKEAMPAMLAVKKDVKDFPFQGFVTEKALAVLRSSVNLDGFWKLYKKNISKEQKTSFDNGLKLINAELKIDVEKDILNNMTGHLGVFFYGLDMGKAMLAVQNPAAGAAAAQLAISVEFKDAKLLTSTADKIVASAPKEAALAFTPLKDVAGARVLSIPNIGVFVQNKNHLYISSAGLKLDELAKLINNKSADKKLNTPLGRPYASGKAFNGLYINVAQVKAQFGALLAANADAQKLVNTLKEASLYTTIADTGVYTHFELGLHTAGK